MVRILLVCKNLKAEKTFCSGSFRLRSGKSTEMVGYGLLSVKPGPSKTLVLELDGKGAPLFIDCRLACERFASGGLVIARGRLSLGFSAGVLERNMLPNNPFLCLDDSLDSLDSCLVIGGMGVRVLWVLRGAGGAPDAGGRLTDSLDALCVGRGRNREVVC